ncbi:MAG TPA: BatD family protein [Chthoniobacterales bacterium]|jgi:hypothetical protein
MRKTLQKAGAVAILCALLPAGQLMAAAATATAVLNNSETAVGQPVQLQIKVTGSSTATPPSEISVDGLDIRYSGQSQLLEGHNFQFSYSFIYNYTVMPLRTGTFKIPPQTVRANNGSLQTPALTLNVVGSGGTRPSSRSGRSDEKIDPGKIGFVQLILSKSTAYVGEMIPAEVRLGFNIHTPVESLGGGIDITGQGFTTQKIREPRQTTETIDGRTYQTFTFKTAIAPARSGNIEIGPVEVNPVVRVPRSSRNPGIPRDLFDPNDPFMDNFFNDPLFMPSASREIKLKSEPALLEVKALPSNAPPSFAGAVGIFTMTTEAKPKSAQVGDPFTVTARISGRGNFDRVTAPSFENDRGWHKYPPSANFEPDDDVGISGAKTFETVLSPNERKENIPAQVFSYFDPLKEQYATLRSDPIPVRVEGGAPSTAAPPPAASQAPASARSAGPTQLKQQEILHQITELAPEPETFAPLYAHRSFWLAQLIPLLGLFGFVGWKIRQSHLDNRELQRREALQQEAAEVQRSLRREDISPQEYFSRASRVVQLKTALAKNLDPNAVDAEIAAFAFGVDDETRRRLHLLFEKSDEARYSGGQNGARIIAPEIREEVLDLVQNLRA